MFVARLLSNSKVVTALTSRERVLCAFLQVTPARIRVVTRTPVTSACSEFPCKNAEDVFNLLAAPYEPPIEETVQNALRHFFQTKDWLGDEEVVLLELPNALCFPTHMNQRGADEILAISKRLIEEAGPDGFVLSGTASGTYGEHAARNFIALARYVRSQM